MQDDGTIIGFFNIDAEIDEVLNEDEIANNLKLGNPLGTASVAVFGGEGDVPHFHVTKLPIEDICVCIYSDQYFKHGVKDGELSSKQKKALDKWLNQAPDPNSEIFKKGILNKDVDLDLYKDDKKKPFRDKEKTKEELEAEDLARRTPKTNWELARNIWENKNKGQLSFSRRKENAF